MTTAENSAAMTAADHYAASVAAYTGILDRWEGHAPKDRWAGGPAEQAQADPRGPWMPI